LGRLAAACAGQGIPLASHDDDTPEARQEYRRLGCRLCEFPADVATAECAAAAGEPVIMGAPNVLRGGSHAHRLSARQAVGDRLCAVLTSDYYYPALPAAPFRLAADRVVGFPEAWGLVSSNAAAAAGLDDRGAISLGQRADLVLIDDARPATPRVAATIAGGNIAYVADHVLASSLQHYPGSEI
jgi:alpha-D-ribose 1-methylphosphonate 5-triphosphate diphosphatase